MRVARTKDREAVTQDFDPYHRWLGIPRSEQPAHHYRLLGLSLFESDPEVIRDAAEQRIAHVRTYQLGERVQLSQRILNELATARACLPHPQTKSAYDAQLRAARGGAPAPQRPPPLPPAAAAAAMAPGGRGAEVPRGGWKDHAAAVGLGLAALGLVAAMVALQYSRRDRDEEPLASTTNQRAEEPGPAPTSPAALLGADREPPQPPPAPVASVPPAEKPAIPRGEQHTVPATSSAGQPSGGGAAPAMEPRVAATPVPPTPTPVLAGAESRAAPSARVSGTGAKGEPPRGAGAGFAESAANRTLPPPPASGSTTSPPGDRPASEGSRGDSSQARQQIESLQRIYQQRSALLDQWEASRAELRQLAADLTAVDASLTAMTTEARGLQQQGVRLQTQAGLVQQQLANESDSKRITDLQNTLARLNQTYAACQRRYVELDREATLANGQRTRIVAQVATTQATVNRLQGEADQLRGEWLKVTDAFGQLTRGDYERAVTVFSEWIVLERNNPLPYVARGLAHRHAGREPLALADFRRASQISPKATAKLIRELQAATASSGEAKSAKKNRSATAEEEK